MAIPPTDAGMTPSGHPTDYPPLPAMATQRDMGVNNSRNSPDTSASTPPARTWEKRARHTRTLWGIWRRIASSPPTQWKAREKTRRCYLWIGSSKMAKRIQESDGPVYGQFFRQNREVYQVRGMGNKCQQPDRYRQGLLLEHRGAEIIECSAHLQQRLEANEFPSKSELCAKRIETWSQRDSSVDTNRASDSGAPHPARNNVAFSNAGPSNPHTVSDKGDSSSTTSSMPLLKDGLGGQTDDMADHPTHRASVTSTCQSMSELEGAQPFEPNMSGADSNLMKHTARRQSVSDTLPSDREIKKEDQAANQLTRQKAFSFDDKPTKTEPVNPTGAPRSDIVAQGRIMPQTTKDPLIRVSNAAAKPKTESAPTAQVPALGAARVIGNVCTTGSRADSSLGKFYPNFLRKRLVPGRRAVVSDDVGPEIAHDQEGDLTSERIGSGDFGALINMSRGKQEEEEEVWSRRNEMSCFALSGFGFFETSLGTGAYSRENRASILGHRTAGPRG